MIWVRSQNKEVLVEVENLAIFSKEGSYEIHSYTECLGKYSTKEKALKVLDMIQERIQKGSKYKRRVVYYAQEYQGRNDYDYGEIVFPMPQDDEVEV